MCKFDETFCVRFKENIIPQTFKQYVSFNRLNSTDQNLFTESNLANFFSSYVQFCSGGHFSERAEAACWSGKMNQLDWYCFIGRLHDKENKSAQNNSMNNTLENNADS